MQPLIADGGPGHCLHWEEPSPSHLPARAGYDVQARQTVMQWPHGEPSLINGQIPSKPETQEQSLTSHRHAQLQSSTDMQEQSAQPPAGAKKRRMSN